jgi:serine/threonine-protein kinase
MLSPAIQKDLRDLPPKDGRLLFVANFLADTVSVIDIPSRKVTTTLPVGSSPHDVVRAPGGRMAVCSYGSGSCTLIDPTGESISSVELRIGKGTSHCTFSSDGEQGFFANSISKNLAAVELERSRLRATILVPN